MNRNIILLILISLFPFIYYEYSYSAQYGIYTIPDNYGGPIPGEPKKLPDNYKEVIIHNIKSKLKDPYSAIIEFNYLPEKKTWAYKVDFRVNAKNSFGSYTGYENYTSIFKDGELLYCGESNKIPSEYWYLIR